MIVVEVANVDKAYWKFIDYYRSLFDIPIIGVTGTCGKTTTQEMIKHRYLLGIDEKIGAAVFEMGVDHPGDLIFYIQYFCPKIRILLNIDVYHLVGCKTLIINADDENINKINVSKFRNILIYFGLTDGCHFQATDVTYGQGGMQFTLHQQNQSYPVFVPGFGKHIYNALAAIAATCSAGMSVQESCERLASFNQVIEHLEFRSGVDGCTVIDDTWNAAPLSMASALEVLQEISGSKTKIALLGYMPQLGDSEYANQQYAKMGEKVVETG